MKAFFLIIIVTCCNQAIAQLGPDSAAKARAIESGIPADAIRVFPNPVVNDLYITVRQQGLLIKSVLIYDKDGNRVIEQKINSALAAPVKISTAALEKGIYYLVLETNKQPFRSRLMKQ